MKRLIPILLLIEILLFSGQLLAQVGKIVFENPRKNFATIAEDGGKVCHAFDFTNTSDKPIVILSVSGGCSCTTAEFSRQPILPNHKSQIVVCFDPMNQPAGQFMRKVVVTTSEGRVPLTIAGDITPRKRSIAESYPIELGGGVRIDANSHAFGYIERGEVVRSSFGIVNTSSSAVQISVVAQKSRAAIDISYPQRLGAGEEGVIDFGYLIDEGSDIYGSIAQQLDIEIDGIKSRYQLIINGIVVDRADKSTNKEWQKIELSENFIKFATLKANANRTVRRVEISNIGLEPLIIRRIESDRSIFGLRLEGGDTIAADASAWLVVELEPGSVGFGAVTDRVRIISNDPQQPVKSIKVSAIIEN